KVSSTSRLVSCTLTRWPASANARTSGMPTWPPPPTTVRSAISSCAGLDAVGLVPAKFTGEHLPEFARQMAVPAADCTSARRLIQRRRGKPCGESGEHASRATGLACRRLRDHRGDDVTALARRFHGRADVCAGGGQPRRLLPPLACVGAASGRDRWSGGPPASGGWAPPGWLS